MSDNPDFNWQEQKPLTFNLNTKAAAAVIACKVPTLRALSEAGGIDPARDFRGLDLRGWPLGRQDVRGFDFSGCDLRDTGIECATIDETTILTGAIIDNLLPGDFLDQAQSMILRGETPPDEWIAYIKQLNFYSSALDDLSPVANLTALTRLDVRGTQVSDLAPLAKLVELTWLYVNDTRVTDIAPLGNLNALSGLNVSGTQVSDLAPLSNLQELNVWVGTSKRADALRATLRAGSRVQVMSLT